jgi:TonB family protein
MPDIKLDPKFHVPEEDPDIHLQRLLAPDDLDEPFYKTFVTTIKEFVNPPKLPPLELTSKPVDPSELKGLNGLYGGNEGRATMISILVHVAIVGLLFWIGSLKPVQKAVKQMVTLVMPPPPPKPVKPVEVKSGGGGSPSAKVEIPRPIPRHFVPPSVPVQTRLDVPLTLLDYVPTDDPTATASLAGLSPLGGAAYGIGSGGTGTGQGGGNGSGSGPGSGGGSGGGAYKAGGDVSPPIPISRPEPQYSEEARKAKWGGMVKLELVVDVDGHTKDIHVLTPLGLGLDEKAIEAVTKWTFKPGMKGGKPVPVKAQIEVTFRLL